MFRKKGELMTKEIAQLLGVKTSAVSNWLGTGRLPSEKRLGRRYIKKSDLVDFLEINNVPIPTELS